MENRILVQCGIHRYDGCMATYTIHVPPVAMGSEKDRFIRDGVSLTALVVPAIWLLWHRLWFAFAAYCLIVVAITSYSMLASDPSATVLSAIPGLLLFLEGNELRRRKLEHAGWEEAGLVRADTLEEAELRWYGRNGFAGKDTLVRREWTAPAPFTGQGTDPVIGIFGDEPAR